MAHQLIGNNADQRKLALEYARQAKRLGFENVDNKNVDSLASSAVEAKFITAQDPVIETASGDRLPTVPVDEAIKLNELKDRALGKDPTCRPSVETNARESKDGSIHGIKPRSPATTTKEESEKPAVSLRDALPPTQTNPLFPPLPMYGPPTILRKMHCLLFRISSAILSFCFLMVLVLGSAVTSLPLAFRHVCIRLTLKDPNARRPFHAEEEKRKIQRRESEQTWNDQMHRHRRRRSSGNNDEEDGDETNGKYTPTEGGPDPLVNDPAYYARRVGLDIEEFDVQTEDGFIISLWHVFDPKTSSSVRPEYRRMKSAKVFRDGMVSNGRENGVVAKQAKDGSRKYPVLLMHGLLQSAGAYCCNDDDSLAFYLAKSGYDVWLGTNRCGFIPRHSLLSYADPRMWAWNIRQMGVMDLPAFVSRVLEETGFEKLGLVCHSQGTTETFVALAKEQRPELGERISVFCALAPAVYAGPLIQKFYFKFMQVISPAMFRMIFGIHAFIPLMPVMHTIMPRRLYGAMGYRVFSFLFSWTDDRWEMDLRNRMFQFAPTYVSAESMRWWLGRECFAKHKCILATRDEARLEDEEDQEEEYYMSQMQDAKLPADIPCQSSKHDHANRARYSWYDERAPPFALWVAGNDDLVDGRRLLRRFDHGREPHVNVVHRKIIEEYEHLDVIWAMDSIEKVGHEVRDVIWRTTSAEARALCQTPIGCEGLEQWQKPKKTTEVDHSQQRPDEDPPSL